VDPVGALTGSCSLTVGLCILCPLLGIRHGSSMHVMTRAPPPLPFSSPLSSTRFGHMRAQSPGDTSARPGARCPGCVSQVGKSPSGHLFEPLMRIFTIINGFPRVEPPHVRAQPELNPHARPIGLSTQKASSKDLSAANHFDRPITPGRTSRTPVQNQYPNQATGQPFTGSSR
jgi:hypothetical protein